jgi:hypothetical protein
MDVDERVTEFRPSVPRGRSRESARDRIVALRAVQETFAVLMRTFFVSGTMAAGFWLGGASAEAVPAFPQAGISARQRATTKRVSRMPPSTIIVKASLLRNLEARPLQGRILPGRGIFQGDAENFAIPRKDSYHGPPYNCEEGPC